MYYVGIDVSKHFHVAYVIDENEKIISSITFENNFDGYNKFISVLENINKDFRFSAALEATGIYFENLFLFLKEKLDKLILINPFISNKFREFNNMNKTKNDKIDALNIAKLIKNNNIISSNVSDEFIAEMKYLNRFKNVKKFVSYAGLFPEISQSGKYNKTKSISKKGNKKIKTAFYQAAVASIRHNNEMKKIYLDTLSKGRAKKEALVIVARKLMHIFYSIYKHNTPYNPERVFKSLNLMDKNKN